MEELTDRELDKFQQMHDGWTEAAWKQAADTIRKNGEEIVKAIEENLR